VVHRRAFLSGLVTLAGVGLAGCGYRPLRTIVAGSPRLRVDRADALVAGGRGVLLADEAAFGARAELARYGALSSGGEVGDTAVDRLAVVVARIEERAEGAEPTSAGGARARGVLVRLTARGVVRPGASPGAAGAPEPWETPDLEASERIATEGSATAHEGARDEALRALARAVGAKVARAVLGIP
jgi:hypothetical protein